MNTKLFKQATQSKTEAYKDIVLVQIKGPFSSVSCLQQWLQTDLDALAASGASFMVSGIYFNKAMTY